MPQVVTKKTSGIPGGYRLVSTYDLPGCKTILKFEFWSFSDFLGGRGVFWNSWIWTLWQFSFGGVFWNSRIWTLWQFSFGGVFWNSRIWTLWQFSFGGVFWNSRIWTLWQFSFGGVFWNSQIWTLWQFSFWGGILKLSDLDSLTIFIGGGILNFRIGGILRILDQNSATPAGSCITDSLLHTTYVETYHTAEVTPIHVQTTSKSLGNQYYHKACVWIFFGSTCIRVQNMSLPTHFVTDIMKLLVAQKDSPQWLLYFCLLCLKMLQSLRWLGTTNDIFSLCECSLSNKYTNKWWGHSDLNC